MDPSPLCETVRLVAIPPFPIPAPSIVLDGLFKFLLHDLLEALTAFLVERVILLPGHLFLKLTGRTPASDHRTTAWLIGGTFWITILGTAYAYYR